MLRIEAGREAKPFVMRGSGVQGWRHARVRSELGQVRPGCLVASIAVRSVARPAGDTGSQASMCSRVGMGLAVCCQYSMARDTPLPAGREKKRRGHG